MLRPDRRYVFVLAVLSGVLTGCTAGGSTFARVDPSTSAIPASSAAVPLPATAAKAAQALFDAWRARDRQAALDVASKSAVDRLWTIPSLGYDFSGTCRPFHCSFNHDLQLVAFYLVVNETDHGYRVERADHGTIESSIPG